MGIAITEAPAASSQHDANRFPTDNGAVTVRSVRQMSVVIESPDGVLYTDPTGGRQRYAEHPVPDIILISHEHREHYDAATLAQLAGPDTRIVVPPSVTQQLPAGLKAKAVSLAYGQSAELGKIRIRAIPAYCLNGEAERWHPRGRGNGYVVEIDGLGLYVAGSTEATPEMLELRDVDVALLPLYPPYALGPADAAQAVAAIQPKFAYVYQYDSKRTRDHFVRLLDDGSSGVTPIAPDIDP